MPELSKEALKLVIEVAAGLVPGQALPDLTRRWYWTGKEQGELEAGSKEAREKWIRIAGESREYAATLENPARVNWVRRDWIWL